MPGLRGQAVSPAMLRSATRATAATTFNARGGILATKRFNSKGPKPPNPDDRSFKGQLLESISSRIARERAEQTRVAKERQTSSSSRNAATTFMVLFASAISYWLGTNMPSDPSPLSTLPLSQALPPKHKTGKAELEAAWADFVAIVGEANVSTDPAQLEAHTTSEWSSHKPAVDATAPFCVVYPASTEDVSLILKTCHARRIPVTAFGGGTSLEGHFEPTRGGVVVDFARMDNIIVTHDKDLDVVVQPAVGWERLNEHLAEKGLFFPPDPGPGATIGGMVGTGCSGTNAYRYGTIRDWVLSLTVVMADGTVVKTRQRPRKSSAGYDLTRLFIGSEGTLGLVTEATLKVTVVPPSSAVAVAHFPTIRDAANCAAEIVRRGVQVAAVEILDDEQMKCINAAGMTSRRWTEAATLFFKFAGEAGAVKEQTALVKDMARSAGARGFEMAKGEEERAELWSARKEALWSTMAVRREGDRVWTGDVAVPVSRLADLLEKTKGDMGASGLKGTIVGHVGDGNFHTILIYSEAERKAAEDFVHRMVKRAVEMEGTVTGEHGVGLVKRDYLPHELGQDTVDAMRKIKAAFDPLCLLNCDKVIRMQKPKAGEVGEW